MSLPLRPTTLAQAASCLIAVVAAGLPSTAQACSSCGCTLNADWPSQGLHTSPGVDIDLRHDVFTQADLRAGTGRVDRAGISFPADQEVQQKTLNRNTTLTLSAATSADWSFSAQLPLINRYHTTIVDGDTDLSTSRSSSLGDLRASVQYQGFSSERNWGIQLGLKLPTGATHVSFAAGPQTGQPLDRGLQPGTGSTDLLLGIHRFGPVNQQLDYFAQAVLQLPLRGQDQFKPGAGLNISTGLRYVSDSRWTPQVQINARIERPEIGANADVDNSGATLVYLSPGTTVALTRQWQLYAFVQAPIYQRVNGMQIEPTVSASAGVHISY